MVGSPEDGEGDFGCGGVEAVLSTGFDDGGASACDSEDFEASMPDLRSSWGDGLGADCSVGRESVLRSSSASAMTAMRVPTLTPFAPSFCYIRTALSPWVKLHG